MTDKKTPEDLAEIFVFEHAHDQFGLSKQECYVAGYNAASQETSLLREENERLKRLLTTLHNNTLYKLGPGDERETHMMWEVYDEVEQALNPKQ
jgi:hypothetical protein